MQRDLGNEVIVAIIAVGVLAFALIFGIILSLSNAGPDPTRVAQDDPTASPTVAEDEPSAEASAAQDVPDPTNTAQMAAEHTHTVTRTVASSPTRTPTDTDTSQPSRTHTATRRPTATATDTATATRTATPVPTDTDVPTATRTATPAPTDTDTPTRTPTMTASATLTRTPTVTATRTPTPTPTETPNISFCVAPFGWVVYTVQPGNTLFSIAQATGAALDDLRAANCLLGTDEIRAGDALYVPRLPDGASAADGQGERRLVAQGCTSPGTVVTSPIPGQQVSGSVTVRGTASAASFAAYRLEVRPDEADSFEFYSGSQRPVINGVLGILDTRAYQPGLYWIRVTVVDNTDAPATTPCTIPVLIESL